jgi:hypothetical protein
MQIRDQKFVCWHPATVSTVEPYVSPGYFTHLLMEGHVRV